MEAPARQQLYDARADGRRQVDVHLDADRSAALDLQLQVLDAFVADGDSAAGWKVSFTSGRSRDRMGPGYRPFGYILRSRVFTSGASVVLPGVCPFALEPELCLVLGSALTGPVDREQARAAVAAVAPAFEINQARVPADAQDAVRLADGTGNWGIVVGTPNPAAVRSDDLGATAVRVFDGGIEVARSPEEPDMDDPFESLATLSRLLAAHGRSLRPGDHVITGSFTRVTVTGSARWSAAFDGLGDVAVELVTSVHEAQG